MTIKTYDGVDLVKNRIENTLSKYPSGSLSPREVMTTLPSTGDDNALAYKTNVAITAAIYKAAEKFIKANPPAKQSFKMTALSDIKVKVDDRHERAAALSAEVMQAVDAVSAECISGQLANIPK